MLQRLKTLGIAFAVALLGCLSFHASCMAQEKETTEPIFRVPKIAKLPDPFLNNNTNRPAAEVANALKNGLAGGNSNSILAGNDVIDSAIPESIDPKTNSADPSSLKSSAADVGAGGRADRRTDDCCGEFGDSAAEFSGQETAVDHSG